MKQVGGYVRIFLLLVVSIATSQEAKSLSLNSLMMTGPKAYMAYAESVAAGAQLGMEECQHQFRWERWNCPYTTTPVFSPNVFTRASRETGFVQSISSAGVMYTLTRNCTMGDIDHCGCDKASKRSRGGATWKWGGCSDNIRFGDKISKLFVDALETGKDARAVVNLHNNEAGRRAVRKTMKMICKCHGVSGACTTKTCWKQLADFRDVGAFLKRRFRRSVKVEFQNGVLQETATGTNHARPIKRTDLVYLDKSPDYCKVNNTLGSHGTLGRQCVRPRRMRNGRSMRRERRSCKELCTDCGLNIAKNTITVETSCNCKFHWCCAVQCEKCIEEKEVVSCAL